MIDMTKARSPGDVVRLKGEARGGAVAFDFERR